MPLRSKWDSPTQPIILEYLGAWTWDEIDAERAALNLQAREYGADRLALIHDMSAQTQIPIDGLMRARQLFIESQAERTVIHIFVVRNPTLITISQVFRRLLAPEQQNRFHVAPDLNAALVKARALLSSG